MPHFENKNFGPTDVVQVDGNTFYACIFDDCEIVGDIKKGGFRRCIFEGRAGDWMRKAMEPHTVLTVDLENGGFKPGPKFR